MSSQKIKPPAVVAAVVFSKSQLRPKFSAKSTATEAQRERILQALRQRPQSTEDLRKLGSFQCAVRVMELRALGYRIETTRITVVDREGFVHARAALYSLDKPSSPTAIGGEL